MRQNSAQFFQLVAGPVRAVVAENHGAVTASKSRRSSVRPLRRRAGCLLDAMESEAGIAGGAGEVNKGDYSGSAPLRVARTRAPPANLDRRYAHRCHSLTSARPGRTEPELLNISEDSVSLGRLVSAYCWPRRTSRDMLVVYFC